MPFCYTKKSHHTNQLIAGDNQNIKVLSSVELLGIDYKLNFNLNIGNICRSAANQLNGLIRLRKF